MAQMLLCSSGLGPVAATRYVPVLLAARPFHGRALSGSFPKPSGARSAPYGSRNNSYQRETRLPVAAINRRTAYVRFNVVALVRVPVEQAEHRKESCGVSRDDVE